MPETPDPTFDGYLAVQARNLEQLGRLPELQIVHALAELYDHSIRLLSPDPDPALFRLLIVCHQAFLSAAATIGRALPADSIGVTRRAVEAARLALAIKHDPANVERWTRTEDRLARWEARKDGTKPARLRDEIAYPSEHAMVESLGRTLGILSDAGAHVTPEFMSTQRWRVEKTALLSKVHFLYFESEIRQIQRALIFLVTVHLEILGGAFDECFDGAFRTDTRWAQQYQRIAQAGAAALQKLRDQKLS